MKKFYFKSFITALLLLCSTVASAQTFGDWTSTNTEHGSTSSFTYYFSDEYKSVTFDWSVSSEDNWDWLIVSIDGTQVLKKSGSASGTYTHTFTTTGSSHKLEVKYTKDNSGSSGSDKAKIYNIKYSRGGECGANATWLLADGTLTIDGTGGMWNFYSDDGDYAPWARSSEVKKVIIGNGITHIGNETFYNCYGLTSITIPNSVTTIGDYAFYGCSSLASITIGNGVKTFGYDPFEYCNNLKEVHITDLAAWCKISFSFDYHSYDESYSSNNPLFYAKNLYLNGELVTNLVIPNDVTYINKATFAGCSGLTSVTIPSSVTSIGDNAFRGCTGLTSVTIPSSVTTIGEDAFLGSSKLTAVHITDLDAWCNIDFGNTWPLYYASNLYLYLNGEKVTNLVIPDNVTEIKKYTFSCCPNLTSVTIPSSVTTIGEKAFVGCSKLTAVHITDLDAWYNIDFGNTRANPLCYAKNLYLNGEKVTNLVIPDNVTEIKKYTFSYCTSLTSVTIPSSVTTIGEYAFQECRNLTAVHISDLDAWCNIDFNIVRGEVSTYTDISNNPLYYAKDLYLNGEKVIDLVIPEGVTKIKKYTFCNCDSINSVTIPENVEEIEANAFKGCTSITEIYSMAEVPAVITETSFPNYSATLYVPYGAKRIYKITDGWSNFTNIVEMEPVEDPEEERLVGDVDGDGSIDIADVAALVEIILGTKQ